VERCYRKLWAGNNVISVVTGYVLSVSINTKENSGVVINVVSVTLVT